jgi:hypothetical protein
LTLRSRRRFPERLAMAPSTWATEANSTKAKPTGRLVRGLRGIEIESPPSKGQAKKREMTAINAALPAIERH